MAQSSQLKQDLEAVEAIKLQMTDLLLELEQTATGHNILKPGQWRQHPSKWASQHPTKKTNKPT
jgi:hypothetical protein